MTATMPRIAVKDLTMAYGSSVIQRDVTFSIQPGEIFIISPGPAAGEGEEDDASWEARPVQESFVPLWWAG
jgi:ABC-type phosphonate transport system ATPase subunit